MPNTTVKQNVFFFEKTDPVTGKKIRGKSVTYHIFFDNVAPSLRGIPLVEEDGKLVQPHGHIVFRRGNRYSLSGPSSLVMEPVKEEYTLHGQTYYRDKIENGQKVYQPVYGDKGVPLSKSPKLNTLMPEEKFCKEWAWGHFAVDAVEGFKAEAAAEAA
jgi:hypothetical protein